jgi:hypothetical protein
VNGRFHINHLELVQKVGECIGRMNYGKDVEWVSTQLIGSVIEGEPSIALLTFADNISDEVISKVHKLIDKAYSEGVTYSEIEPLIFFEEYASRFRDVVMGDSIYRAAPLAFRSNTINLPLFKLLLGLSRKMNGYVKINELFEGVWTQYLGIFEINGQLYGGYLVNAGEIALSLPLITSIKREEMARELKEEMKNDPVWIETQPLRMEEWKKYLTCDPDVIEMGNSLSIPGKELKPQGLQECENCPDAYMGKGASCLFVRPLAWRRGCTPTSAAMLLVYWDERGYTCIPAENCVYQNGGSTCSLIDTLANNMQTNENGGTYLYNIDPGIENTLQGILVVDSETIYHNKNVNEMMDRISRYLGELPIRPFLLHAFERTPWTGPGQGHSVFLWRYDFDDPIEKYVLVYNTWTSGCDKERIDQTAYPDGKWGTTLVKIIGNCPAGGGGGGGGGGGCEYSHGIKRKSIPVAILCLIVIPILSGYIFLILRRRKR